MKALSVYISSFFCRSYLKAISTQLCWCVYFKTLKIHSFFFFTGNLIQAAFWYGLVVHFRIYPIIYSLPLLLVLNRNNFQLGLTPVLQKFNCRMTNSSSFCWKTILTKERAIFGLLSGSVFFLWTALFFYFYGWEFLNEALLYHLTRVDPRHNFSIYFYHIYLHHQSEFSIMEKLASFFPQLLVQTVLVSCFFEDLQFCFFVQTVAFVSFNKVTIYIYNSDVNHSFYF